jgi:hypothetical protein
LPENIGYEIFMKEVSSIENHLIPLWPFINNILAVPWNAKCETTGIESEYFWLLQKGL